MICVKGIHHVSINVVDVAQATHFYEHVIGLQRLDRPQFSFPGAWLQAGAQQVHLVGINSGSPLKEQHFAFHVDDVDNIRTWLVECECSVTETKTVDGICRQIFTRDPSGNLLEFNQPIVA